MNIHFEKLNPMKNQFLTALIRIVSIGLFFLIVVLPSKGFAQVEEPRDDNIPEVLSGMFYTISELFKNRLLEQRCHIELNDKIEIKEKKKQLQDFIKNNPDIGILDLKIT